MPRWLPPLLLTIAALAVAPACEPAPCCTDDQQCGEGLGCFDGRCSFVCTHDHHCAPSEICVRPADGRASGICYAPGEDRAECRERNERPRPDAGPHDEDAGLLDAGPSDAGRRDAGRPDAGRPDAGRPDAGPRDAGSDDAGPIPDGGPAEDGGGFDAGPPSDSGPTDDAGPVDDAGPIHDGGGFDAGPTPDAGPNDDAGPVGCVDDEHEPNNTVATATPVSASTASLAAVACPNDPDLYEVPVVAGESLRIGLGYEAPPGMRLTVTRPGQGVLGTSATGSGLEQVSIEPASSGSVLVRVVAVPTGEARPYGLLFERSPSSGCVDDAFEPNDSAQQATPLTIPVHVSARICAPDPDFFAVAPAGASPLRVRFEETPDAGLILSVLRRSDFTILAVISAGSGPRVVDVGEPPEPLLFIVAGNANASYTLAIE